MEYQENPYTRRTQEFFMANVYAEPVKTSRLPKILSIVLMVVVVGFVSTGILFIAFNRDAENQYRRNDPTPQKVINRNKGSKSKVTIYNELGQMRPMTKPEPNDETGSVMVVTPWFSFPDGDTPLYEEISQKDRLIKNIIFEYFTTHTKSELLQTGEKTIKEELTEQINEQLVMGKITKLYFDEYQFFK
ncbi:MAG: flagellar basal body-associated FliL family protein [Treponema sp.]|nr:flagellar basal body-associated FliL family protein [Treponema sp.]